MATKQKLANLLLCVVILICISCDSSRKREKELYHQSLERAYDSKQSELTSYYKKHDSLVRIDSFRKAVTESLDTIMLKVEEIKARTEYQVGPLPKKLEFTLMRIDEDVNDLRSKIRDPKEAEKEWDLYKKNIEAEMIILKETINKL